MKFYRKILLLAAAAGIAVAGVAQVENAGGVRKRTDRDKKAKNASETGVTDRMQGFFTQKEPHDADLSYMREIYRQLDLTKPENTPLYYPEDVVDGQKNLFRIILGLVVDGKLPAYEYLDGREVFTDEYKVNVAEMLDRFGIYYQQGKGSTERNPKYVIEEADVPTGQVLNYYILEKWEFDRRSNRMKTRVVAICPVLNRSSDFGGEAKYPMFWVKYDQIRPHLAQQYVFLSDDNNLAQYSIDDYFNLGMYKGDIYKTRNLRNLSMMQMYPDPDDRRRAQDSIQHRLETFDDMMWVPTREEVQARGGGESADSAAVGEYRKEAKPASHSRKPAKVKAPKKPKSSADSGAKRSVRRRR